MKPEDRRAKERALRQAEEQKQIVFFDSITASIGHTIDPAASFFVSLFRTFSDEKRVYFILEHAAGGELFARLKSHQSRFPIDVARFYAAEIVIALDYLHNKEKTVFRDLQPENILLDGAGHLKLCDFGNAKCLSLHEAQTYEEGSVVASSQVPSAAVVVGTRSASMRYSNTSPIIVGSNKNAAPLPSQKALSLVEQVTAEYRRSQFIYNQNKINENRPSPENYVAFSTQQQQQQNQKTANSIINPMMMAMKQQNNNDSNNNNNNNAASNTVKTFTICGVAEYTAPEIVAPILQQQQNQNQNQSRQSSRPTSTGNTNTNNTTSSFQGYSFAADWWSLGIVIFEMLAGYPPFFDDVPNKIFEKAANASRDTIPFPSHFDTRTRDLISGLLNPDPAKRLGSLKRGVTDIMKHRFFAGIDWAATRRKQVLPPDMIRESLVKATVVPSSVMKKAQSQAPASNIVCSLPLNIGSFGGAGGKSSTTNNGKMRSSAAPSLSHPAITLNHKYSREDHQQNQQQQPTINHLHDEQFDPSSMNSLESLRRRELVSAELADMFLGYPYDKYPDNNEDQQQQQHSHHHHQAEYGSGRTAQQKPLTDAQQEVFACFG